jgi:hypothetical protein
MDDKFQTITHSIGYHNYLKTSVVKCESNGCELFELFVYKSSVTWWTAGVCISKAD